MADPLSIATGCVSLLSCLAAVSKQINLFVKGVRDARIDMIAVSRELRSLELSLVTLQDDSGKITYPTGLEDNIKAVLANCGLVVADIKKLTNLEPLNMLQRMDWAANGSTEINKLRGSLEAHKTALEIALQMTTLLLVSEVKDDVAEVKDDTELLKARTDAIKQDTSQIPLLVTEISRLHTEIAVLRSFDSGGHFLIQRFLNESASCAVSIGGFGNYESNVEQLNISEGEADLESFSRTPGEKALDPAFGGTVIIARHLKRFSFQSESESSFTSEPLMKESVVSILEDRPPFPASEETQNWPLSRPSTSGEELPLQQLPDEDAASRSSIVQLDEPSATDVRPPRGMIDKPQIKASKLARKALTVKQRTALDIRLRAAVQGVPQGGKGFVSFRLGNDLGTLQEIRETLDAGADANLSNTPGFAGLVDDKDRMNALDFEINNAKREDVVELLLSRGSSPNGLKIHTAIKRNDEKTLKKLLEYGANPLEWDDYNRSALYWAAEKDSGAMISTLLQHGASVKDSVSYDNSEALEHACKLGHVNAVRALVEAGATTRQPGKGPLWNRRAQLKPEIVALIEKHGGFKKRNAR